jgi:hypothetical protein
LDPLANYAKSEYIRIMEREENDKRSLKMRTAILAAIVLPVVVVAALSGSKEKSAAVIETALATQTEAVLTQLEDLCDTTDIACRTQARTQVEEARAERNRLDAVRQRQQAAHARAFEDCTATLFVLGVGRDAGEACQQHGNSLAALLAANQAKRERDPIYRATRDGIRDALMYQR